MRKMMMGWFGLLIGFTVIGMGCSDYSIGNLDYKAPELSTDANALVDVRGNIDFGAKISDKFSQEKVLTAWVFDANQGARITAQLISTNGEDPVLILYGPINAKGIWGKAVVLSNDGATDRTRVINDFELKSSGRFLLAAATEDGSSGGTFDILLGCRGQCDEPACPDIMCDLYCPNGFLTDENGCPICLCKDPECQKDEDCVIPWADSNTGKPLTDGQIGKCIEGKCVFDQLYCDENTICPDGYRCEQGPCMEQPCSSDGTTDCPTCPGMCVPDVPVCAEGEKCEQDGIVGICVNGMCVPEGITCTEGGNECPEGMVCQLMLCPMCENPDANCPGCTGICVPEPPPACNPDDGTGCPDGFECIVECWSNATRCDSTNGETCPPDSGCVDGACDPVCVGTCVPIQPPECKINEECRAGGMQGQCIDGRCVFEEIPCDPTVPETCPPDMECLSAACQPCDPNNPDNCYCPSFCVPKTVECYFDTDCIDANGVMGRCVDNRCVFEPLYCNENWECPPGYDCQITVCSKDCDATTDPNCCQGVCVPSTNPQCYSDEDCMSSDGQIGRCINGICVFDPCNCTDVWQPVCAEVCMGMCTACPDNDPSCVPGCTEECFQQTYSNVCYANCEGARVVHEGTCEEQPGNCKSNEECGYGFYCEFCLGPDGSVGTSPCSDLGVCLPLPVLQCQTNEECPDGFRCDFITCSEMPCREGTDCPPCWGTCVPANDGCIVTGCSGELCAPYPISTSCVWLPEYECLQFSSCELLTTSDGQSTCGWVQNAEYLECLENINNAGGCQSDAECPPGESCQTYCDSNAGCQSICLGQDCVCPDYYDPVCGVDGVTYGNICELNCARMELAYPGPCGEI